MIRGPAASDHNLPPLRSTHADARWLRWAGLAALVLLPPLLLAPFRHAGFVADDFLFAATPSGSIWETVTSPWAHPLGLTVAYRPLTSLSYMANQALFGYGPEGFHLVNALLHGINAALLSLVVRRLTASTVAGVVAALLFVCHPVTHESVVWISGRTYPLAALFSLAALMWVMNRTGEPIRSRDHVVVASLVLGALLSYEAALPLPLLITALVWTNGGGGRSRLLLTSWLALAAYLALRYGVLTTLASDLWLHLSRPEAELGTAPVFARLHANTLAGAARLLGTGLGRSAAESTSFQVTACTCLIAAWAIARQRQVWRAAAAAAAVVTIGFVPFATYIGFADRFAYLSAAGVAAVIGVGIGAAWSSRPLRAIACGLLVVMLTLWGRQYALAAQDWVTAGRIAQDLLADLHHLEPSPASGARFHFLDIPYRHGAAMVYITHLDLAVNLSYGRHNLVVTVAPAPTRCATVLRWLPPVDMSKRGALRLVCQGNRARTRHGVRSARGAFIPGVGAFALASILTYCCDVRRTAEPW